jgi:hypothetical protein
VHTLEPFAGWLRYYDSSADELSPFFGKAYNFDVYSDTIYGYYIDPAWDNIGSETLYLKTLYTDYELGFVIVELLGEWNDAIHNDIMTLKREFLEVLMQHGIRKFMLLGGNIMNFHGSDDSYYEEWHQELDDGWIALVDTPDFVCEEMRKYRLDNYVHISEDLQISNWRTLHPQRLFERVEEILPRRLGSG